MYCNIVDFCRNPLWVDCAVATSRTVAGTMTRSLSFLPDQCDMRLHAVVDYWRSLPSTKLGPPLRRDFDPLDLPSGLLPYIWMVNVEISPSRFRFRLCGSHLVDALQFDPTGRYYDELFAGFAQSETHLALAGVRDTGEPSWRAGNPHLERPPQWLRVLERVFLPLSVEDRRVDIILAASVYRTPSGREV